MANPLGIVVYYSITTRKPDFNPTFTLGAEGASERLILGKTKMSSFRWLGEPATGVVAFSGAWRGGYSEVCYGGSPGNYQTIVVSSNDSGLNNFDRAGLDKLVTRYGVPNTPEILLGDAFLLADSPSRDDAATSRYFADPDATAFRSSATIDTLTVTEPNIGSSDPKAVEGAFEFGIDFNQARLSPEESIIGK
jgi:hypothetical protein